MEINCSAYIIESYTPSGFRYKTLFSDSIEKNYFIQQSLLIKIEYNTNIDFLVIHQNITPPHLYKNMLEIGKFGSAIVQYSFIRVYLEYPYETNCYRYGKNFNNYISKEDCIVKYLQKKRIWWMRL